jgi:hypothetical protein
VKIGRISPGDVCLFLAHKLASPKFKYHVCVTPASFFYINTKAIWTGCFPVSKESYNFLEHDSFIGCGQLIEYDPELDTDDSCVVTRLTEETIRMLLLHLNKSVTTLSRAQYRKISRSLKKLLESGPGG